MRKLLFLLVIAVLAGVAVWAQGSNERDPEVPSTRAVPREKVPERSSRKRTTRRPLRESACPDDLTGCRSVSGRVVYVESVDPDGDGDLHVVLAAGGVTGPGITSVDIARELRPPRDPRIGDQVSAAGQVQRGSFGQSQIHAVEIHVRRR